VVAKNGNEWSAPSAIGVGGAGFGFQIGGEITNFVLVLNTKNAVDAFAKGGNVTLGGDLSIAAGPIGRTAEGSVMPFAAVYTYSRSKGLFAGISLEGTVVGERKKANEDFYKKRVSAGELLSGKMPRPASASELYKELPK
jgi:lipid-binding SYLF domain-containing protein